MKKYITVVIWTLLIATLATAQHSQADFKNAVNTYFDAAKRLDYEAIVEAMYPEIFTIAPKEVLLEAIKKGYNTPGIGITLGNYELGSISKTVTIGNAHYMTMEYAFQMTVAIDQAALNAEEGDTTTADGDDGEFYEFMVKMYQTQYGKKNVVLDEATHQITIHATGKKLIGIFDPQYGNAWKFIEYKAEQRDFMEELFPEGLFKKLKIK